MKIFGTNPSLAQTLETYWLAASPFVAGEEVSIADILLLTELDMLHLLAWAKEVRAVDSKAGSSLNGSIFLRFVEYHIQELFFEGGICRASPGMSCWHLLPGQEAGCAALQTSVRLIIHMSPKLSWTRQQQLLERRGQGQIRGVRFS